MSPILTPPRKRLPLPERGKNSLVPRRPFIRFPNDAELGVFADFIAANRKRRIAAERATRSTWWRRLVCRLTSHDWREVVAEVRCRRCNAPAPIPRVVT